MESQFRIISNGLIFRIEKNVQRRFLWWRWETWVVRKRMFMAEPVTYWTKSVAQQQIAHDAAQARALHEWRVVPEEGLGAEG